MKNVNDATEHAATWHTNLNDLWEKCTPSRLKHQRSAIAEKDDAGISACDGLRALDWTL